MAVQSTGQTDLRALKALVAFLGVLIVVGTAVVIGTVIHRMYARTSQPSIVATAPSIPGMAMPAVSLQPGERVAGIAAAGGDVAVWATGPAGDRVLLINPQTGGVTVALAPK
jgi:hypothetical protein